MKSRLWITITSVLVWELVRAAAPAVHRENLPAGRLQPVVKTDSRGRVHRVTLYGKPDASDIEYQARESGDSDWSPPVRVNSEPGSAIAVGTIRGADLGIGRDGTVHVLWNGSGQAKRADPHTGSPLLYARKSSGSGFSAQKDLAGSTHELDGGGAIVADSMGRVMAVWQASPHGKSGETNRHVYAAVSLDDGLSFGGETPISADGMGACGCCGLAAAFSRDGDVSVLFRAARTAARRDMVWLSGKPESRAFSEKFSHPWNGQMCPMSSAFLSPDEPGAVALWENAGSLFVAWRQSVGNRTDRLQTGSLPKHPRMAVNHRGETAVVWTEGTGWKRGGRLAWQLFDATGKPITEPQRMDGIPAWSFAAVHARPDGSFSVLY